MISAIILAGGKGKRLGIRKAFVEIFGKPLIEYMLLSVFRLVDKILLSTDAPYLFTDVVNSVKGNNIVVVKDRFKVRNPLSGIISSMYMLKTGYVLVLPCDTPLIKPEVLKILVEEGYGVDALIPQWENGFIEPLHAVYRVKAFKESILFFKKNQNMSIQSYISTLNNIKYLPINRLRKVDTNLISFLNINTDRDLIEAKKMLESIYPHEGLESQV